MWLARGAHREGSEILTIAYIEDGTGMQVPTTAMYRNPKSAVIARDLPYTARTRMKKRMLLMFSEMMVSAFKLSIIIWQSPRGDAAEVITTGETIYHTRRTHEYEGAEAQSESGYPRFLANQQQ